MKQFLDKDFLLETETAKILYHNYAENMPIFDFHCHLSCKDIFENKRYSTITRLWLGEDHYKWRLMREAGVEEEYITGNKSDFEKFQKYAQIIPYAIGNPIYHWTHLELRRYFGINDILSNETAKKIYDEANEKLKDLTVRALIEKSNVKKIFTTDDPADDLIWHKRLAEEKYKIVVKPTFRPDKALNIQLPSYAEYIAALGKSANIKIDGVKTLLRALEKRINYFADVGCVCSDHALDEVMFMPATEAEVDAVIKSVLSGNKPTAKEVEQYKGFLLVFLGRQYHARGWVQQYHIGALRNVSTAKFGKLGADCGCDTIGDKTFASKLSQILDSLDQTDQLPKTILYCLNPRDNEVLAAMMNCFQQGGIVGKIQYGSAWWFNDQKDGMNRQMETLMQVGLISKFVGMLTDSRSFLSYVRHEYFRRILCNKLAGLIENGEYPDDIEFVGKIVGDICYHNAEKYFM